MANARKSYAQAANREESRRAGKFRLLSLLCLLTIPFLCHYFTATAQTITIDGIWYTISGSEASVTGYDYGITEANILESVTYDGTDYPVTSIGESAFNECSSLQSVYIPNTVTLIKKCAFMGCSKLVDLTIPNSVIFIGYLSFANCYGLESINIPESVFIIAMNSFEFCSGLKEINVSELNEKFSSEDGILFNKEKTLLEKFPCGKSGECIIPSSVTSIGDYAFYSCEGLTSVTIPNSVTSIGDYAFYSCKGLTSVTIPNSVTYMGYGPFIYCSKLTSVFLPDSITYISRYAFGGCTNLTSVIIPESVNKIGERAFQNCSDLTEIIIPLSVSIIESKAFDGCESLSKLETYVYDIEDIEECGFKKDLPCILKSEDSFEGFGNTNLTFFDNLTAEKDGKRYGFVNCDIPLSFSGDVYSENDYYLIPLSGSVIKGNSNISEVWLNGEDITKEVLSPNGFFFIPSSIHANNIIRSSGGYSPNITIDGIHYTISGSEASVTGYEAGIISANIPESVSVGNYNYPITSISKAAFKDCNSLTTVTIPNSITLIKKEAFWGCSSLTKLIFEDGENVLELKGESNSFSTSFLIPDSPVEEIYLGRDLSYNNDIAPFIESSSLKTLTVGTQVTTLPHHVFALSGISEIFLSNSVKTIELQAFFGCSNLHDIIIPNSVTTIQYGIFQNCKNLNSLTFEDGDEDLFYQDLDFSSNSIIGGSYLVKEIYIGRNFSFENDNPLYSPSYFDEYEARSEFNLIFGNSLSSIPAYSFKYIPGVRSILIPSSVMNIGAGAFCYCPDLMEIIVSDSNANYCSEDGVLYDKEKETLIQYPSGLKGDFIIPNSVSVIGAAAFVGSRLSFITLPESLNSIEDEAFEGCVSLTSLNIPDSVTSIGDYAFSSCIELTSATIGNSVTSIGSGSFWDCISLSSVSIGRSVKSIGSGAFSNCMSLTSVIIPDSVFSLGSYAFHGCTGLTYISIGKSVKSINTACFWDCPEIKGLETYSYEIYGIRFSDLDSNLPCVLKSDNAFEGIGSTNLTYFDNLTAEKDETEYGVVICDGPLSFSGCRYSEGNIYLVPLAGSVVKGASNVKEVLFNGEDITAQILSEEGYSFTPSPLHAGNVFQVQSNPIGSGDVNGDGKVTVADVVTLARHLNDKEVYAFNEAEADVNGDGTVDSTDVDLIADMIQSRDTENDVTEPVGNSLTLASGSIGAGSSGTLPMNLRNTDVCHGFQTDLILPPGLSLESVTKAERSSGALVSHNSIQDNPLMNMERIVLVSLNAPVAGNNGTISNVTFHANGTFRGGEVTLTNSRMSNGTLNDILLEDSKVYLSSVGDLAGGIADFSIGCGEKSNIPFTLSYSGSVAGLQTDIILPENLHVDNDSFSLTSRTESFNLLHTVEGNRLRILLYSPTGEPFAEEDMPLFTFDLVADENAEPGNSTILINETAVADASGIPVEMPETETIALIHLIEVEGVSIDYPSSERLDLVVGKERTLTATVMPANAYDKTVTWSVSDSAVATIDNGTVTPLMPGNIIITASAASFSDSREAWVWLAGDVNGDYVCDVNDVVGAINYIIRSFPEAEFIFLAADFNDDGEITVSDAVMIALGIVNDPSLTEEKTSIVSRIPESGSTHTITFLHDEGKITVSPDSYSYTAFQTDIILPEGVKLADAELSEGASDTHILEKSTHDSGKIRLLVFSTENSSFLNNSEPVLNLHLDGENTSEVMAMCATGVTSDGESVSLKVINKDINTEVTGITSGGKLSIEKSEEGIVVKGGKDRCLRIFTTDGKMVKNLILSSDEEIIPLENGLYMIQTENVIRKIII